MLKNKMKNPALLFLDEVEKIFNGEVLVPVWDSALISRNFWLNTGKLI